MFVTRHKNDKQGFCNRMFIRLFKSEVPIIVEAFLKSFRIQFEDGSTEWHLGNVLAQALIFEIFWIWWLIDGIYCIFCIIIIGALCDEALSSCNMFVILTVLIDFLKKIPKYSQRKLVMYELFTDQNHRLISSHDSFYRCRIKHD